MYVGLVPSNTPAAVFSIDGSLTASVSVSGRDPRVRAGAVDVGFTYISLLGETKSNGMVSRWSATGR